MATTSDLPSVDGRSVDIARVLLAVLVVAGATGAGWMIAGPPGDDVAIVPPSCPATLGSDAAAPVRAGWLPGVVDQLVPMPLPQPRGPVSVRVCRYAPAGSGFALRRDVVLDPTRTAALAGLLNRAGPSPPSGGRPAGCPTGSDPAVLVFRYTQGDPLLVEVPAGPCSLVLTRARAETGRTDVVRAISPGS